MSQRGYALLVVGAMLLMSGAADAVCTNPLPEDADRVNLRAPAVCAGSGLENCVESMADVNCWLAEDRHRTAPPPVVVDIGAGTFGPFSCSAAHLGAIQPWTRFITIRGSGRNVTTIEEKPTKADGSTAMAFAQCAGIEISHLTVKAANIAIGWSGGGDSTYTDLDVHGDEYAWYENDFNGFTCPSHSNHWSWSSLWSATPGSTSPPVEGDYGWAGTCSRAFFFDSEITGSSNAIVIGFDAEVRMFGSVIRVVVPDDETTQTPRRIWAVANGGFAPGAQLAGEFHMHGGLIAVDGSRETDVPVEAVGIISSTDGISVTQETAFLIKGGGGGTARRLWTTGSAASPLLLAPGASPPGGGAACPPGIPQVISVGGYCSDDGQDLYVETDCLPNGDCESGSPSATETHLMVYTEGCDAAGPWFDTVTERCRGALP